MSLVQTLSRLNFPVEFNGRLKEVQMKDGTVSCALLSLGPMQMFKDGYSYFNPLVIDIFEKILGLNFESETALHGNVCMANEDEVRSEYRTIFTTGELLEYIFALLPASEDSTGKEELQHIELPFPQNSDHFWKIVWQGRVKRNSSKQRK